MSLKLELPEEFKDSLQKTIQEVYLTAIDVARRDAAVTRDYLTVDEACKNLKISRNTLVTQFFNNGLTKYKIGNRQYILKNELKEFIKKHQI